MDAGIDFLTLTTRDFIIKDPSLLAETATKPQGKSKSEIPVLGIDTGFGQMEMIRANKLFYNHDKGIFKFTVNSFGAQVIFNPSKILHPYNLVTDLKEVKKVGDLVTKEMAEIGILLNLDRASVSRLDLTKQAIMNRSIAAYASAFSIMRGKRLTTTGFENGYRWNTKETELQFYDKGVESKLPLNNLIRLEDKFKKTRVVKKICGFNNYCEILMSDSTYLTQVYNKFTTDKLFSDKVGYQSALDFENEVDKLRHFKDMGRNAVMKYLVCNSLEDFILKFGKIDVLFDIMFKAGFDRSTVSRERQNILDYLKYANVSEKADVTILELINELKLCFAA